MEKKTFQAFLMTHSEIIGKIHNAACELHDSVNQTYGKNLPYGHHLKMVATAVTEYGNEVVDDTDDILPLIFAAYYHDSIEDARLSYNDVMAIAKTFMTEAQATTATEIVYALTNEKGRTREDRANDKYYAGIRATPYAPFVKLCDRLANMNFCITHVYTDQHMKDVYAREWPHFIEAITTVSDDKRFSLPKAMIEEIEQMLR